MPLSLDFAFEGFRIIREKPKLVLFWGVVLLIGTSLANLLFVAIAGADYERLQTLTPSMDQTALMGIMTHAVPNLVSAIACALPVEVVMTAVLSCAVFRAAWGQKDDRFGYLRFGIDEWIQIAVQILLLLIGFGLTFAVAIAAAAIGAAFGNTAQGAAISMALLVFGLVFVAFALLRLSLCTVQSFDRKAVDIAGSWKLTAKHGWTLLGGYLVTAVMIGMVYLLCVGIFDALAMIANGGQLSMTGQRPDMTSLQAFLKPLVIAGMIYGGLLVAPLITALRFGALAAAYRTLAGQTPDAGI